MVIEALGGDRPVTDLDAGLVAAVFEELWTDRAAATWNTRRVAIRAFATWCADRWPLAEDPLAAAPARRQGTDNARSTPYADLEELWRRRGVPIREKTLWRMLYETAARASEVLALDVEDPDRACRRARIRSKGGDTDMVVWAAHRPPLGPLPRRPRPRPAVPDRVEDPHRAGPAGSVRTDRPSPPLLQDRRGRVP